ncbi:MAG: glycosyltransferase family 4 protein, partial [Rhodospirillales bacterium]|nr:glycosyltransferase family 4 protein [Rhodospirillales bacterium]
LFRVLKRRGLRVRGFTYFDAACTHANEPDEVRVTMPHAVVRAIRHLNGAFFRLISPGKAAYQTADVAIRALGARRLNRALAAFAPDVMIFPDHGSPGMTLKARANCRRIMIAHHNPGRFVGLPHVPPHSRFDARMALAFEARVLNRVDKVICPSRYMEGVFREGHHFDGLVETIPNILDTEYLDAIRPEDPRPAMGLGPRAPLVYIPSGGNAYKGAGFVPEIVQGLAARADGPVGVFVSGGMAKAQRDRFSFLENEQIRLFMPGAASDTEILARVKACNVCVYPTLVENYSMAILEAVNCAVPVVSFDVGGNAEIIAAGETGFLAPAYDVGGLVDAAAPLLAPETAQAFSARAQADARARLCPPSLAERWVEALTAH